MICGLAKLWLSECARPEFVEARPGQPPRPYPFRFLERTAKDSAAARPDDEETEESSTARDNDLGGNANANAIATSSMPSSSDGPAAPPSSSLSRRQLPQPLIRASVQALAESLLKLSLDDSDTESEP
jgi:hypothetical protein